MVVRCPSCQTGYRLDGMRVPPAGVRVRCPRCAHVFRLQPDAVPTVPPAPAAPPTGEELTGIERDHREPPRLRPTPPPRRGSEQTPSPAAPRVPMPAWHPDQERTLSFDTPAPKGPPPRLETAPFRPGETSAPAPAAPPVATPAVSAAPGVSLSGIAAPPLPTTTPMVPPASISASVTRPFVAFPPNPVPGLGPAHDRARRLARVLVSDILVYNQALRDQAHGEGRLASALGPEISKAWELYKSKVSPDVVANTTYFKDALNEILAGGEKIF